MPVRPKKGWQPGEKIETKVLEKLPPCAKIPPIERADSVKKARRLHEDKQFIEDCKTAGVEPTIAQARRLLGGTGSAYLVVVKGAENALEESARKVRTAVSVVDVAVSEYAQVRAKADNTLDPHIHAELVRLKKNVMAYEENVNKATHENHKAAETLRLLRARKPSLRLQLT